MPVNNLFFVNTDFLICIPKLHHHAFISLQAAASLQFESKRNADMIPPALCCDTFF